MGVILSIQGALQASTSISMREAEGGLRHKGQGNTTVAAGTEDVTPSQGTPAAPRGEEAGGRSPGGLVGVWPQGAWLWPGETTLDAGPPDLREQFCCSKHHTCATCHVGHMGCVNEPSGRTRPKLRERN